MDVQYCTHLACEKSNIREPSVRQYIYSWFAVDNGNRRRRFVCCGHQLKLQYILAPTVRLARHYNAYEENKPVYQDEPPPPPPLLLPPPKENELPSAPADLA